MINIISFFTISYILTQLGYFLGHVTKEELKEIKFKVTIIYQSILQIFFFYLIYLMYNTKLIWVIIILNFIYLLQFKYKKLDIIIKIFLLPIILITIHKFSTDYLFLISIIVFKLILVNSFERFDIREFFYEITIGLLTIIVFNFF